MQAISQSPRPMPFSAQTELLVLGCGPAGYSAAVYAARADLRPILVTGTTSEEPPPATAAFGPWPADVDLVRGPELKRRLRDHSERASTRVVFDCIDRIGLGKRPFKLIGSRGTYSCDALIVAIDRPISTVLFEDQLEMKNGRIVTWPGLSGMATMTSRRGVFVVGDVKDPSYGGVITSTGTACMAALDAQRFLGH